MPRAYSPAPIVGVVKAANAAFRFLLELCTLAVFVYWGFATADGVWAFVRGGGLALLTIAVWGTFGAPNAPLRAAAPVRLALLAAIYAFAVALLWSVDQGALAVALAVAAAANTVLLVAFGQE
jgi:hypothetical protein